MHKKKKAIIMCLGCVVSVVLLTFIISLCKIYRKGEHEKKDYLQAKEAMSEAVRIRKNNKKKENEREKLIEKADIKAAMYDYDSAISIIQGYKDYNNYKELVNAIKAYKVSKASCVKYKDVNKITHIFFHTLIKDPKRAFDGDSDSDGYQEYMVTIHEFNKIIESMYKKGYVMVRLKDIARPSKDKKGRKYFKEGEIWLPKGKKPFVLSQDDVCYYHYMKEDGMATKLVIDDKGDIKNEYIEEDGTVSVGDYDLVPVIDRFVEQHPDFSYRGAKGYIAVTGYNGILGYRTDIAYQSRRNMDFLQKEFIHTYPGGWNNAAYEKECSEARKVAGKLKEEGWMFASHTWGHRNMGTGCANSLSYKKFKYDVNKWEKYVEPLIGKTDVLIYAFGGDIGDWHDYSGGRYRYLKKKGFNYFCGVDGSSKYWMQRRDNYIRQARRNIDGYRMYYYPDKLKDLFRVDEVWDPLRPMPVPTIE